MAAAAAGIPSPPASLARTAAATAIIFLWLAFAVAAATEIGRVTYSDGSLVVTAASRVNSAAYLSFVLFTPVATLLFIVRAVHSRSKAEKKIPALETEVPLRLSQSQKP